MMVDPNQPQFILPEQQTHLQQTEEVIFKSGFFFKNQIKLFSVSYSTYLLSDYKTHVNLTYFAQS
jgi:hypothetical protein